jgi:hypothetical protein
MKAWQIINVLQPGDPKKKASATTDIKAFFGQKGPKWL